ncbi:kin of IRRE-like protein 3 [Branchiostoma floridae x Branchiostoma japonicum]
MDALARAIPWILLLWTSVLQQAECAYYQSRPQSTAVLQGETIVLSCAFRGLQKDEAVLWEGPPNYRIISNGRSVSRAFNRHRVVGKPSRGEFNLEIQDVQREDTGGYRCSTLSVEAASDAVLTVVVPMEGPPDITGAETSLEAGSELYLRCKSRGGFPAPRLAWYNGTRPLPTSESDEDNVSEQRMIEMFIPRLTKWDNGANLSCVADQGYLKIVKPRTTSRNLRVNYPPTISVPSPSIHVKEGQSANLTCYVDSNPRADMTWTKMGGVLPTGSIQRDKTLQIPRVSKLDSGVYRCEAENGMSPTATGAVTLEVFYPPKIDSSMDAKVTVLFNQDDFSLKCQADGNPKPHIRWRRKDTALRWENPLRFHRIRYDVEGIYQCIATNDGVQYVTRDVEIDVVGQPDIRGGQSLVTVNSGGTARLYCDIVADPVPEKAKWVWRNNQGAETILLPTNNGIMITEHTTEEGTTSIVTVQEVREEDGGVYICKATNMFGSDQKEIRLNVKGSRSSLVAIISVSVVVIVLAAAALVGVLFAKRRGWIFRNTPQGNSVRTPSRPMPPLPKHARKPGHGTNDSGVEDLELQEMDGTLKPRPPSRVGKDWAAIGLTYGGLAHTNTLPPYSTVERHRPEGEDGGVYTAIREETSNTDTVMVHVEPPPQPPSKDLKSRWKGGRSQTGAHARDSTADHEEENVLNEIQADSL